MGSRAKRIRLEYISKTYTPKSNQHCPGVVIYGTHWFSIPVDALAIAIDAGGLVNVFCDVPWKGERTWVSTQPSTSIGNIGENQARPIWQTSLIVFDEDFH